MKRAMTSKRSANNGLRRGDVVMVIAGGNHKKRPLKGKTGKIVQFVGAERVIVEGLNLITRHQRALGPNRPAGKVTREAALHISNIMYYAEKIKRPVRLKCKFLSDGKKVRGYTDPKSKEFVQVAD